MTIRLYGDSGDTYNELLEFLKTNYPIPEARISYIINYKVPHFSSYGEKVTGFVRATGSVAEIDVAAKGRFKREIAITILHEYKHCLQFIRDNMTMTSRNLKQLEQEAKDFAEGALNRLWTEQKIFYPSVA